MECERDETERSKRHAVVCRAYSKSGQGMLVRDDGATTRSLIFTDKPKEVQCSLKLGAANMQRTLFDRDVAFDWQYMQAFTLALGLVTRTTTERRVPFQICVLGGGCGVWPMAIRNIFSGGSDGGGNNSNVTIGNIDVIEISNTVIELGRDYFGLEGVGPGIADGITVVCADALQFIARRSRSSSNGGGGNGGGGGGGGSTPLYDLIVIDVGNTEGGGGGGSEEAGGAAGVDGGWETCDSEDDDGRALLAADAAESAAMPEVPPSPFLDQGWLKDCLLPCLDPVHGVVACNVLGSEDAIETVNSLFGKCFRNHAALATEDDNVVFFGMQSATSPTAAELFEVITEINGGARALPLSVLLPEVMAILLETPSCFPNRVGWMTGAELSATLAARQAGCI